MNSEVGAGLNTPTVLLPFIEFVENGDDSEKPDRNQVEPKDDGKANPGSEDHVGNTMV